MKTARIFPRRTNATPDDGLVYINCPPPMLGIPEIDEVHVSVAFTWDIPVAERLAEAWRVVGVPVRMGGPALGKPGGKFEPGLYLKQGYTITSRGCPNHCWFCAVSKREGGLRELPIRDGYNVLDDNLLACSDAHVEAVFQMLRRQPERPLLTGGLEARLLKPWHARRLREIKAKRMYFAYDTPDDYEPLVAAGRIMRQEGHTFEAHSMCCYVLIGYAGDTVEHAEKRLADTVRAGFSPFPMLYKEEGIVASPYTNNQWAKLQRMWIRPELRDVMMSGIIHGQRNSTL